MTKNDQSVGSEDEGSSDSQKSGQKHCLAPSHSATVDTMPYSLSAQHIRSLLLARNYKRALRSSRHPTQSVLIHPKTTRHFLRMRDHYTSLSATSLIRSFVDHRNSAQATAETNDANSSEDHQAALALLQLHKQAMAESSEGGGNEVGPMTFEESQAALTLLKLRYQPLPEAKDAEAKSGNPAAMAEIGLRPSASSVSVPTPQRLRIPKSSEPGQEKVRWVNASRSEDNSGATSVDGRVKVSSAQELRTEKKRFLPDSDSPFDDNNNEHAHCAASEAETEIEDTDMTDVDGSEHDSDETEIIVAGATPPTSPFSQAGQSIQPADSSLIPQTQRMQYGLLAQGDEGFEDGEPLEQWEWLSILKMRSDAAELHRQKMEAERSEEKIKRDRQESEAALRENSMGQFKRDMEEYEQDLLDRDIDWAMNGPIELPAMSEDSDYEEKRKGKRGRKGAQRSRKAKISV